MRGLTPWWWSLMLSALLLLAPKLAPHDETRAQAGHPGVAGAVAASAGSDERQLSRDSSVACERQQKTDGAPPAADAR